MSKLPYIGTIGYRIFKKYIRFVHNRIFYRHSYYINKENIPSLGEPCMIVSNHQNCANDPLALLLGLENESHPFVIARGNVFSWHPIITKFFLWLGMLPAFRLNYDGEESLKNNAETIRVSGGKMLEGNRLIMYPEGGHQNKRWLGDFSYGYTRLAFQTAESDDFKHDIKILPCANHYSDYFGVQEDFLITFGTPISLQPYYELYKVKPRTAQREVNKLVRAQIENLMLDIRDLDHYDEIDWLRNSEYGIRYCERQNLKSDFLPNKLQSDKELVSELANKNNEQIYKEVKEIREAEQNLGITEQQFTKRYNWATELLSIIAQIVLLPLWLVSLYPNAIHYNIHRPFMRTDNMFTNSWRFIIPAVVGIPFFFIATILVCGLTWGLWWQAAVWMLLATYPLALFAFYYHKWCKNTIKNLKALVHNKQMQEIKLKRQSLFEQVDKTLND